MILNKNKNWKIRIVWNGENFDDDEDDNVNDDDDGSFFFWGGGDLGFLRAQTR